MLTLTILRLKEIQAGMMLASTAHMKSRCLSDTYNAAVISLQVYLPHRMPKVVAGYMEPSSDRANRDPAVDRGLTLQTKAL
jgi:hypothetical protein